MAAAVVLLCCLDGLAEEPGDLDDWFSALVGRSFLLGFFLYRADYLPRNLVEEGSFCFVGFGGHFDYGASNSFGYF